MRQKQRNKIAWILTAVFAPLLIYLVAANIAKVGKNTPPEEPAAAVAVEQIGVLSSPGAETGTSSVKPPARPPSDPKALAEQNRIAALLPENNPFNPSRSVIAEPLPVTTAPAASAPHAVPEPSAVSDTGIKLTAIVSRQGGSARIAMINGRFLGEGDHIAGWTIIKVTNREVLLKDGDRQMVLRLK